MSMLLNYVKSFARNEEGQDLLEYALLVALIALIAIGAVGFAGQQRQHHLREHRESARGRWLVDSSSITGPARAGPVFLEVDTTCRESEGWRGGGVACSRPLLLLR